MGWHGYAWKHNGASSVATQWGINGTMMDEFSSTKAIDS